MRGHYEYYKFLANYGQTGVQTDIRTDRHYGRTDGHFTEIPCELRTDEHTDRQTDISYRFLANYVPLKFVCLFVFKKIPPINPHGTL